MSHLRCFPVSPDRIRFGNLAGRKQPTPLLFKTKKTTPLEGTT